MFSRIFISTNPNSLTEFVGFYCFNVIYILFVLVSVNTGTTQIL